MLATQREVARRAKTSLKTVSRVINNDPMVNAETRSRIETIIAELGYQPDQAARMMRSQKSNIIGFLAEQVTITPSSIELVRGAQDVAWERGKQMMLLNIARGSASEGLADAQLAAFRAEAIIYATVYHQPAKLLTSKLPHILLNCFDPEGILPSIVPDDYKLAYDLTQIIFERGYRRPVFLNLSPAIVASDLRGRGFVEAARTHGLDVTKQIHNAVVPSVDGDTLIAGRILSELMSGPDRPDIILCGQDIMAMNVYFELHGLGITIGKHVAVASFDNLQPIAGLLQPGLSTMELPYYEMGRAAMTAAIDGSGLGQVLRVPGKFIDRQSL